MDQQILESTIIPIGATPSADNPNGFFLGESSGIPVHYAVTLYNPDYVEFIEDYYVSLRVVCLDVTP